MDINYLDDERKKLWAKVSELEELIKTKTSDIEEDIRKQARIAKKFLTQIETTAKGIKNKSEEIEVVSNEIYNIRDTANEYNNDISAWRNDIEPIRTQALEILPSLQQDQAEANEIIGEIRDIYANNPDLQEKLEKFNEHAEGLSTLFSKTDAAYQAIVSRKNEIDTLYYNIIGYTDKDEQTGEDIHIDGLKDELETIYNKLKSDFSSHKKQTESELSSFVTRFTDFEKQKNIDFESALETWNSQYDEIVTKINDLLPKALTTGLSYAFSEKKEQEIKESKAHADSFMHSIIWLVVISLIPLGVSITLLLNGIQLDEIIFKLPRLTLSILPLYIPVLWIAYSSNRKGNLSKRLIEEYSHKEALSKTYEGLNRQITCLSEHCDTMELKEKLLFNLLEVSSENPGKLISDYNKSDHPLMDALDKSVKLTNSIEILAKLPGFSRITNILSTKAEKLVAKQRDKAEQGLATTSDD